MKKFAIVILFLVSLVLFGCKINQDVQKVTIVEPSFKSINVPASFKLVGFCDVEASNCVSPILELLDDRNFTLTLNMCESVEKVEGIYAKEDDMYFLFVNKCLFCKNSDRGLSTVNIELKQVANDELKVTNEVYRIEDGQKAGFCAPSNDPYDKYDGFDYNLFKLVKVY